jgi:hypothetical protein
VLYGMMVQLLGVPLEVKAKGALRQLLQPPPWKRGYNPLKNHTIIKGRSRGRSRGPPPWIEFNEIKDISQGGVKKTVREK